MDDYGDWDKKSRSQRKRKAVALLEQDGDSGSDDYKPPSNYYDYRSDDSDWGVKKVKKFRKRKKCKKITTCKRKEGKSPYKQKSSSKRLMAQGKPKMSKRKKHSKKKNVTVKEETNVPVLRKNVSREQYFGPHAIIGHWYIATGFTNDLTALFKAFDELESWRFSAFATCWQKMKFSLIYRGRHSFKELLEFTEEACFWTKKFISPIHHTKWRVGALYTMYGLYTKHPIRCYYKLRLEANEYEHLEYLARSFETGAENPDPAYIFYKLKAQGVFQYVATSDEMGPNFYSPERQQDIMNYETQWVLHENSVKTIFPEEDFNIQKTIMEEYEKVKSQLWDGCEPFMAMSYVQSGILSEVDGFLTGLQNSQVTSNQRQSLPEEPDIGQKRGAIRDRAAALSTTDDFLKRKQLRSPQKFSKGECHTLERSTGSFSGNGSIPDSLSVFDVTNKVEQFRGIMECMQTSKTKIHENSSKSEKIIRKQPQEHLPKEHTETATDGSFETEDLHDSLLLNEPSKQKYGEWPSSNSCKGTNSPNYHKYEKANSQQQNENVGKPGSCNILLKAVEQKRTPGKSKGTKLAQRERKKNSNKAELRNFRYKPTEKPQVLEKNEITIKLEDALMENFNGASVSGSNSEERDTTQEVTTGKISSKCEFMTLFKGQRRKGKPRKNRLKKNVLRYNPNEHIDDRNTTLGGGCLSGDMLMKTRSSVYPFDKHRATKKKKGLVEDQVPEYQLERDSYFNQYGTIINFNLCSPSLCYEAKQPGCLKGLLKENITVADQLHVDNQGVVPEWTYEVAMSTGDFCKEGNRETIKHSKISCRNASVNTKLHGLCSDQPEHETTSHTISNKQIVSASISQENCGNVNPKRVVIVKIVTLMPMENQFSILQAEKMILLHTSFEVEGVIINSTTFGITRENLKAVYSDEKKLESLKKVLRSFLPPEFMNHEIFLESAIHKSVFDNGETPLFGCPEDDPHSTQAQEYSEQFLHITQVQEYTEQCHHPNQAKEYSEQCLCPVQSQEYSEQEPQSTQAQQHSEQELQSTQGQEYSEDEPQSTQAQKSSEQELQSTQAQKYSEQEFQSMQAQEYSEQELQSTEAQVYSDEEPQSTLTQKYSEQELQSTQAQKYSEQEFQSMQAQEYIEQEPQFTQAQKYSEQEFQSTQAQEYSEQEPQSTQAREYSEQEPQSTHTQKYSEQELQFTQAQESFEQEPQSKQALEYSEKNPQPSQEEYSERSPQPGQGEEHFEQGSHLKVEKEYCKEGFLSSHDKEYCEEGTHSRQGKEYCEQDVQLSQEKDPQPHDEKIFEVNSGQSVFIVRTDCKEHGKVVCPNNISEKVYHQVKSSKSFNNHPKHDSVQHSNDHIQFGLQGSSKMNYVENTIHVRISARMPKRMHHKSILTGESMMILDISFLLRNILIHSTKFKIAKKDLECIHSDKKKLDILKKKMESLLPPKYKNSELLIQLNYHGAVVDKSGTPLSAYSGKPFTLHQ